MIQKCKIFAKTQNLSVAKISCDIYIRHNISVHFVSRKGKEMRDNGHKGESVRASSSQRLAVCQLCLVLNKDIKVCQLRTKASLYTNH